MSNSQLAVQLFLQLAVILAACRVVGMAAAKCGQPQVVAEMVTGILLGPSLFGYFWPEAQAWLFPADSQRVLYPLAQLGLALYMFVVGMEFRTDIICRQLRGAAAVAVAGMAVPLLLGAGLAWLLYHHTSLFPAPTVERDAMLFLGAALSITAVPMLARIIEYKKLKDTTMGAVSLGAGAVNDAGAWALLAIVLASRSGDNTKAILLAGAGLLFVLGVLTIGRRGLRRLEPCFRRGGKLSAEGAGVLLALMAGGAWFTDLIGLHAVLGAFVMGVAMPRGLTRDLTALIEPLTAAVLLPLFFVSSGLNTRLGMLFDSAQLWLAGAAILVVAVAGKGVACWLAARAAGISNREALGIGTLMNVRGLIGLIVLNIGLDAGILSPGLFAVLVVMAVITSIMASPILDRLAAPKTITLTDSSPGSAPIQPTPTLP